MAALVVHAEPLSSAPSSPRRPTAHPAPKTAVRAPSVAVSAFASTRWLSGTTCGSAADRPDPTKRLMPVTSSAET